MSRMVLATSRGNKVMGDKEHRSLQGWWGSGYPIMDPAAIPPPGYGQQQRAGVLVTQHTMLQVDVVFTAMRVISNNIIRMGDLWAYTRALSRDNIPYKKFLAEQPAVLTDTFGGGYEGGRGGAMMQCTGRDRTVWSMGLFGEAFWYIIERSGNRLKPRTVEVLHPAFMDVKDDKGKRRFIYGTGQNKTELDPDDVIHIPFKSLPQARRAMNPVTYAGVAGALAMAAYEFGSTWFAQGSSPSFLLATDQKLGQAEVERIAMKFQIDHAGLANAHVPLVLDSGIKATKIMASPDEAQYLRTLEYARNVIASWFGLFPSMLGNALERQTPQPAHTSQEEAMKFLQHTLSGYSVPLEEAHAGLLPRKQLASFNETALSRPDAQSLAMLITSLRQAQVGTINDLRTRYLEWGPVDDPAADDPMAPLASNTAPSQTGPGGGTKPAPKPAAPAAGEEKQALAWLLSRMAQVEAEAYQTVAEGEAGHRSLHVHVPAQPAPVVNVEAKAPAVYNQYDINVAPSPAPDVKVKPTLLVDATPKGKRKTKVLRDPRTGRITGTEEE